ncbi:putative ribonuclease H-like domain-containing protein [Tanacetum coccineum]
MLLLSRVSQSPFTYPNPNPSASPSFTQDDTFMPNPSASPSLIKERKFENMGYEDSVCWIVDMMIIIFGGLYQQGNSPRGWEKDAKGNTLYLPLISLDEHLLYKGRITVAEILSQLNSVQARPDNDDTYLMSSNDALLLRRSLELDVRIGHSYGVKVAAAPTHSAFIGTTSSGSKPTYSDQQRIVPSVSQTSGRSDNLMECVLHSFVAENEQDQDMIYEDFDQVDQLEMEEMDLKWQMAMLSLRINREGNVKTVDDKARYLDFKDQKLKKQDWVKLEGIWEFGWFHADNGGVMLLMLLLSFAMLKEEKKNGVKFVNGWELQMQFLFHKQEPICPPNIDSVPCKSKAASVPAGSRNSSASVTADGSDPAASRNRPAVNSAGRPKPTERVGHPAGWSKRPAPVSADRPVSAGWLNPAARPFFRPSSVYFNNMYWPNLYDPMYMNKGRWGTAGDPSTDNDIGIVDSGCSRSMTGNKEKLDDFVQVKGGIVKFGGGDGRISGKGTIRTSKLDFENVYYVEELQHFNLFSVSQICDKKNKVLFTDTDCLVLTEEFQLPDESQVVLRIPRERDLYTFSISELQPEQNVTCLVAKASLDESTRWHRRMAHVNFKTINKLAKEVVIGYLSRCSPMNTTVLPATKESNIRLLISIFLLVSITNPHNKTPYELISGKVPQIGHLKPFGCQVTILNTSDHLGKFEGKADEGYLVGYASNSKAYRVYNLPNKRVEETLNLRFLEDKPNVQGIGHEWYFDLDYLTDSLGYTRFKTDTPAGTQETNINAGTQDHDSDSEVDEQVIVVPSFPSNSFAGPSSNNGPSVMERNADYAEELAKLQRQEYEAKDAAARYGYLFSQATAEILCQAETEIRNQGVSADRDPAGIDSAGGVSAGRTSAGSDPAGDNPADSFELLSEQIPASTLPPGQSLGSSANTTRFPLPSDVCMDQLSSGIFTSSSYDDDFSATLTNVAPVVDVNKSSYEEGSTKDYHTDQLHCLFGCFLSQLEPTSIAKALEDPDWVAAMQEEMQQFINQQMDVSVPFLWSIEEEVVHVTQPKGFEILTSSKLVYEWSKLCMAFIKHQSLGYNFWYMVYVVDIFSGFHHKAWCARMLSVDEGENFEMSAMGEMTFFLGLQVKQLPDGTFISQDRSMDWVTYVYQSFNTDIMFAVRPVSRHQVTPQDSHLMRSRRLIVISAGSHGDRKSTTVESYFWQEVNFMDSARSRLIVATLQKESRVSILMLVVILSADDWFLLFIPSCGDLFLLVAMDYAAGSVYMLYHDPAGDLVLLVVNLFLLSHLVFAVLACIAGWLVSATSHLVSAGSLHSCWWNNVSAA